MIKTTTWLMPTSHGVVWSLCPADPGQARPYKAPVYEGQVAPWLTAEIEEAIRHRDRLARLPRTAENREAFRRQRNRVTSLKRGAMRSYFANVSSGTRPNPAQFHRRLQQATGLGRGRNNQPHTLLTSNGELLSATPDICDSFASYFESCIPAAPVLSDNELSDHISIKSIRGKVWPGFRQGRTQRSSKT